MLGIKGSYILNVREAENYLACDVGDAVAYSDTDGAREQTDNKRFGVKEMADILFSTAERTDNADFLDSLNNRNVGDDAYHYGGNDEGDGGKGDKGVGYYVDHCVDEHNNKLERIEILNAGAVLACKRLSVYFNSNVLVVPLIEIIGHEILIVEAYGINGNTGCEVASAKARRLDGLNGACKRSKASEASHTAHRA